jgi:hypothetical protein
MALLPVLRRAAARPLLRAVHRAGCHRFKQLVWPWMLLLALGHVQQSCSFALSPPFSPSGSVSLRRRQSPAAAVATNQATTITSSQHPSFYYLSDLPTPALLVDVDAAARSALGDPPKDDRSDSTPPRVQLTAQQRALVPVPLSSALTKAPAVEEESDASLQRGMVLLGKPGIVPEAECWQQPQQHQLPSFGEQPRQLFYLHARVVRGRQEGRDDEGRAPAVAPTFLCELDLPGTHQLAHYSPAAANAKLQERGGVVEDDGPIAQLVLGLNNHHVGSYYWARSAGSGAAMEAPGIELSQGSVLRWKDPEFSKCNSNDGKRSEWANFLRPGDQVQLVPANHALMAHIVYYAKQNGIYGVSTRGRPMGSEPIVACRYELRNLQVAD